MVGKRDDEYSKYYRTVHVGNAEPGGADACAERSETKMEDLDCKNCVLDVVQMRMGERWRDGEGGEAARRSGARTSQTQTRLVVLLGELLDERLGLGGAGLDLALERRRVRDGAARELGVGLDDLAVLDRLFDLEHGEDHRDREPHGRVGELETRADAVYTCQRQRLGVCWRQDEKLTGDQSQRPLFRDPEHQG